MIGGRPKARTEGVISERVDDDLVVYDQVSRTAHCLSPDAAAVWEHCDGRLSPAEIARRLELAPEAVERAVDALGECRLLDEAPVTVERPGAYSRREATVRLAKAGGAALAGPLIYSAAVGSVAAAASPSHLPVAGDYSGCAPAQPAGTLVPGTVLGVGPVQNTSTFGCNNACGGFAQNCGNYAAPTCSYGVCYQSSPSSASCPLVAPCDLSTVCCQCFASGGDLGCSGSITYRCATQYNCRLDGQPCPGRTDVCGPSPSASSNGSTCAPPTDGTVTRLCCTANGTATGPPVACSQTTGPNFGCCGGYCQGGVCAPCPSAAACAPA